MTKTEFDKFVTRQKAQAAAARSIDAKGRRKDWLAHIEALYERVGGYLQEYISRGDIVVDYEALEVNEEILGSYRTRKMALRIGTQVVELVPIGAVIIGASGRVDLVGSYGRSERLLLVGRASQGPATKFATRGEAALRGGFEEEPAHTEVVWKFATAPPTTRYIELTPDTLMDAIMGVAGG